ncbi:inverted formin-2-like [Ptychodera flava]|uniref:inverted formin-2-like n=1 Tax=Ptychodera flava TaxID=63121 RepID=UPI00396A97A3
MTDGEGYDIVDQLTKFEQETLEFGERDGDIAYAHIENDDPTSYIKEICEITSLQDFDKLKTRLTKCTAEWMDQFLQLDGLGLLLEALEKVGDRKNLITEDAFLQLECVQCIKTVLNSKNGIDFIIENRETKQHTRALAFALDSLHVLTKKMVFEILSALSVYSMDGCGIAIDALEFYKKRKNQRYRFSIVINELKSSENLMYTTTLIGFINSLLDANDDAKERRWLRNEFIGLGLLDIMGPLRHTKNDELCIQLKVFDERKAMDDDDDDGYKGIDMNCPIDVFHAVFKKVSDSPQGMSLLSILQHFLQLEPESPVSDTIWQTTEKFLRRATVLGNAEQIDELVKVEEGESKGINLNNSKSASMTSSKLLDSTTTGSPQYSSLHPGNPTKSKLTPPSPPPPPPSSPQPPQPPPPPPPPPPGCDTAPSPTSTSERRLPRFKLKTLHWAMISSDKFQKDGNMWQKLSKASPSSNILPQYDELEDLFSLPGDRMDGGKSKPNPEKVEKPMSLQLGDKWLLNVNICLKGFNMSSQAIVNKIQEGKNEEIEVEKLMALQKLLPKIFKSEKEKLTSFSGDRQMLGTAERFLLKILDLKNYELRLDCMLIKAEFDGKLSLLESNLQSLIKGGHSVLESISLQNFFHLILAIGNFMNTGSYAGNASGFAVSFLNNLKDIKAKHPRLTLLHHLVRTFGQDNCEALIKELEPVSEANRYCPTELRSTVYVLSERLDNIQERVLKSDKDIKEQMSNFLKNASHKRDKSKEILQEVDQLTIRLAEYLCEDEETFTLKTLFSTIDNLRRSVKHCQEDNEKWAKRNLAENISGDEVDAPIKEKCTIDMLLDYIAKGFQTSKKRHLQADGALPPSHL